MTLPCHMPSASPFLSQPLMQEGKPAAPRAKSSCGNAAAWRVPAGWGDALGAGVSSLPSPCQETTHTSLQKPF